MRRNDSQGSESSAETSAADAVAPGKVTRSGRIFRRATGAPTADPDAAVAGTAGSMGAPLPAASKARFESSLGTDLSAVRVHTGAASASAADELGARAFATGPDIHFGAGQFQPDDPFGVHLLAHEVAHTVQQGAAASGPQAKLAVSEPGDAFEVEADRAADAMIAGTPIAIAGGSATQVARQADPAAAPTGGAPAAAGPAPIFVEFTKDGVWDGAQVLATLSALGPVPADLQAAILAGAKPTASYLVELRGRVTGEPATTQPITSALTSRVTELFYATSRSPLTYVALADCARWAVQFSGAAPAAPATAPADPTLAAAQGNAAAETYATKLASVPNARVRTDDKDVTRDATMTHNDSHTGAESGSPALTGWSFVHDPFDNTVVAARPDGTGLQFTYQAVASAEGQPPVVTLLRTEELPTLRVQALKRMEKAAPGRAQEGADGPAKRLARDVQVFKDDTAAYDKAWADYRTAAATNPNAKPPTMAKPTQHMTTACTDTPSEVYHAGGGDKLGFPFTPPINWRSFHKFTPGGVNPKPGDVYWLSDIATGYGAHMGVVKSRVPIADHDGLESWVVTDGGQGGYTQIQQEQERTRGPYNVTTGIFSSSLAEAGQQKGLRKLVGWVDIEEYNADPTMQKSYRK